VVVCTTGLQPNLNANHKKQLGFQPVDSCSLFFGFAAINRSKQLEFEGFLKVFSLVLFCCVSVMLLDK
jgi:hypothetical protein